MNRLQASIFVALGALSCAPAPPPSVPSASPTCTPLEIAAPPAPAPAARPKVIVFVWDGLRPDSITEQDTPNLVRLRDRDGVNFAAHHSVYPTFTMMNAAALATGAYPEQHGFFGNTEYQPGPSGKNAEGKDIDFEQPVFTEDHGVLQALDSFNRARGKRGLFAVPTLFEVAHAAGLRTASIGKIGPAFAQDVHFDSKLSVVLDENTALPLEFARALQAAHLPLPVNTARQVSAAGEPLQLAADNGKPTAPQGERVIRLADGVTPDPRSALGSAHDAANEYLMRVFASYVLPELEPDLSVIWLRNPDSTEHTFGPGSSNYRDALRAQDALLGELTKRLDELGLRARTDLLVMSDHGHSTVAGDAAVFPLRALRGEPDGHGEVAGIDAKGYAVSGDVRTADLLARAGFVHVYDGGGCLLDPVLSGIRKDGSLVYPTRNDAAGRCDVAPNTSPTAKRKPASAQYSTPSFRVPKPLPKDAVVIAANGGSEYFYVPSADRALIGKLIQALQERVVYGPVFVSSRYGNFPGTLPLSVIHAEAADSPPTPDIVTSYSWDEQAVAGGETGLPGTEYASAQRYRGMHGTFSPRDVHNVLIASGPHFHAGFVDPLPTSNVDVAPTVASLLGLRLDTAVGRVLREGLTGSAAGYEVKSHELATEPLRVRRACQPDDPSCARSLGPTSYRLTLTQRTVKDGDREYTYFDRAQVTRSKP